MTRDFTCSDLLDLVHGDLGVLDLVLDQPHEVLRECSRSLPDIVVSAQDVGRVLHALLTGEAVPDQAQRWTSFVRRGYAAGGSQPIEPISINYERAAEDQIADVVGRLDEIGDLVDGDISPSEILAMLDSLMDR